MADSTSAQWSPATEKDHSFYSATEYSLSNSISIHDEDTTLVSGDKLVPIGTETNSLFGQIITKCADGEIGMGTGFVAMDKSGGMQVILTSASVFFKKGTTRTVDSAKFYLQRNGTNYLFGTEIIAIYIHPKFDPLSDATGHDIAVCGLSREHFDKVVEVAPSPEVASWGGTNPDTMVGLKLELTGYTNGTMHCVHTTCVSRDCYVNGGSVVAYEAKCVPSGFKGCPISLTLSLPGDRKRQMVCGIHSVGNRGTLFTPDLYEWILARLRVANMKS